MATGGGELSGSLVGSSDVIHDFSCTPCAEDEKNTEAIHYCVNCETYFCHACIMHHNKVLKSHTLLDKAAMATDAKQTKKNKGGLPLPTKECEDHPGNIVQMFCGTHDVCCCTVCIALEHRACKDVDFIPKLAKGILEGKERYTAKLSLENLHGELLQLKSKKRDELTELEKTKQDILKEIQELKERLIARVNGLERKSRDEVCEKYEKIAEKVNNDIDTLNDLLQSAESKLKSIEQTQSSESELFIEVKCGQKFDLASKLVRQQLSRDNVKMPAFVVRKDTERFLNKFDSFGTVKMTENDDYTYSATLFGEYNVKIAEDKQTCAIYDLCVLDDNRYIITDVGNNKVKRLDKAFSVSDWCDMPGPWGVCKIGTNEVAVSLCSKKEVMFVSCVGKLASKRSFKVGFLCRGIKCYDDRLYIWGNNPGKVGEIKVYSLAGSHLHTFKTDSTGNDMFTGILQITFSLQNSYIHIAGQDQGLITLDTGGNKLSVVTDKRLESTFGVCTGYRGQVYLCDDNTGSVFQLNKHNGALHEILTQSDGIQNPKSVTFIHRLQQLVVTCINTNTIKVFQLI